MSSKVICIVHGRRPCECLRNRAVDKDRRCRKRSDRRSERRLARQRVRETGESYSVALEAVRRDANEARRSDATPTTKLGAALATLEAPGVASSTAPANAATTLSRHVFRDASARAHHPFRDTWLRMNARMAEPTVREVERSVRDTMRYARSSLMLMPPTYSKQGLLRHLARLETPLEVAQAQRRVELLGRIRDLCAMIESCLLRLDRAIEERDWRYRRLYDSRWGIPQPTEPSVDPTIEAAVGRVRARLAQLQGEAPVTPT
ncbi:MAG: hypothetical protein K8M05_25075 [Deltaproteobacteria bacterium]|nr:hypothetical protein [Kofleriaceae bacterium]